MALFPPLVRGPKAMRLSKLFFQSLRETPAEAEVASHQLLLRAGLIRQVTSGIFEFLPLGMRVRQKVELILREEMNAIEGQEMIMPVVQPAEIWQRSGRWYQIGDDLMRMQDRSGRDMCLAMTHEEVITDLVSRSINSYKQLPVVMYQIQTKFRDEPRARGGLLRVREFTMKDAYSFHTDFDDLDQYYPRMYEAYFRVFRRAGLDVVAIESDSGMMGGTMAHEFMAVSNVGEDTLILCRDCDYRANRQVANFRKNVVAHQNEMLPKETVHTPDCTTIEELARFLDISQDQTAKAIFMVATLVRTDSAEDIFVFCVVRGDMSLNETKLANALNASSLRPATEAEIRAMGAEPGFGSPVGVDFAHSLLVVDDLVAKSTNLVAGANRSDYHYMNLNYGRDYEGGTVADIVSAEDGHCCVICGGTLYSLRGVEVGNTFKLGTKYSETLNAYYSDSEGTSHPIVMASYGIGVGRLIACIVEQYHDEHGITWPLSVAPYALHLISLATAKQVEVRAKAEGLYEELVNSGLEVLYDDRDDRAGVKFNDADLIGVPLQITVGSRGLAQGQVELKVRRTGERHMLDAEGVQASLVPFLHIEEKLVTDLLARDIPLA